MTVTNVTVEKLHPFGVAVRPSQSAKAVTELPVERLRELVRTHHLLLLRGFASFTSPVDLTEWCGGWGEISMWPFGAVLELVEHEDPSDHIFDNSYVPLHWDGMYRKQIPEFQVFHCVSAPGESQGGRTTFSNTSAVLDEAAPETRRRWEQVTGTYRRKMEYYDSTAVSPVVATHPVGGFPVLRYGEPVPDGDPNFINHPDLEFTGVDPAELGRFHDSIREALYAPEHFYRHIWRDGDVVVADNYTLLHGREAFTSRASRHLRRVHVLGDPPLHNSALVD
ncbi:Taurine dioxygenase, alpha-ketoglutarate-dependent [Amycolatopsis marina]|uniref:Taurine dioxygenase, alpha-ketoglutarate-dependent n=1 Tax=Amycolatopsis marina TaxID=490629 RepID=A0A1I1CL25_9PSEU|nr:TauD/TfdA family dioxygenase [Amycolatopsis marina]SFB61608.1 Taurine dioxygenase, alpha-ketoglutarate-dependent [Amycolatopsis marina]